MSKKTMMVIILSSLAMLMTTSYNACSGVKFSNPEGKAQGDTTKNNDDDDFDDPKCESPFGCDTGGNPLNPKDYEDVYTVTPILNRVDVLLVLDNSGSMEEENNKLADRLGNLTDVLNSSGVDWQMCYTTTDMSSDGERGRIQNWRKRSGNFLVSIGTRVINSATPDLNTVFKDSLGGIGSNGSGSERGIVAAGAAVEAGNNSDCYRNNAAFALVIISDEDQKSCGGRCRTKPDEKEYPGRPTSDYTNQYRALDINDDPNTLKRTVNEKWPTKPFTAHTITIKEGVMAPTGQRTCYEEQDVDHPAFYGIMYQALSTLTSGIQGDICANDYGSQLAAIGTRITNTLASITLRCAPYGAAPEVTIAPNPQNSVPSFDGDKIFFNPQLPEGTQVTVKYTCLE